MSGVDTTLISSLAGIVGAAFGAVGGEIVRHFTTRKETSAHAMEMMTDAAGNLADRLARLNERLDGENRQLRTAIMLLTDVVDQIIPLVSAPHHIVAELKKANNAAKMAV
jgi:hypothetical protein